MSYNAKFFGMLGLIVAAIGASVYVFYDAQVGTTARGNPVLVRHYVGAIADLWERGLPPKPVESRTRSPNVWATITPGIFEAINIGAEYQPLADLIGPGELRSDSAGYRFIVWGNPDGSAMTLTVRGGRIISKSQYGLHR